MVKDTIKGIPIPSAHSILSSFCPETIDNQIRNIDLFKNISFPMASFKDEYNMQIINSNSNTFINDITNNKELGIKTNSDKIKNNNNNHSKKKIKKESIASVKKEKKKQNEIYKKIKDFSTSEKVLNKSNHNKINSKNRISKDNFVLNNNNN